MIKENKTYFIYYIILFIFSIIINILFLYNIILFKNIENIFRISFLIVGIIITIIFNTFLYLTKSKKLFTSISIIFFIFLLILIIISYNLNNIYSKITKITINKNIYSSSIVTTIDNDNTDITKIDKIGIINDKDSIDGYIIPNEIIDKNNLNVELINYNDYISMINDLLDKKIDYIFLPTNYKLLFNEIEFNGNIEDLKTIYSQEKEKENKINNKKITEPFTILLMGVDSTEDNISNSYYNGDALMLITFNPKTKSVTMLSIPRDSYLNISCMNNRRNKITHSAWHGEDCIINTLNNTFNINIDYYIKINFKGLVNLVDNIGGIDVDVPYNLCESDSNRLWGSNTIYIDEGMQHLNGEQALALSRNRHPWNDYCDSKYTNYYSSDIIRGENQQKVLSAIIEKIKTIKSIDIFNDILDTISNNVITNLSTDNILSFYEMGKNINKINIQKLYLNGYDSYVYDYDYINNTGTKLTLYNYIPYKESINELSTTMNNNLDGNLSVINEVIGDVDGEEYINLMPNFIGSTYYEVEEFCNKHNIKLSVNYVNGSNVGYITNQNIHELTDLEYVDSLSIDVVNSNKEINNKSNDNKNNTIKNNDNNINENNSTKDNIEENNDINNNSNNNNNNNNNESNNIKDSNNNIDSNELDPIINEIFN